jgi:hypothetical protein
MFSTNTNFRIQQDGIYIIISMIISMNNKFKQYSYITE